MPLIVPLKSKIILLTFTSNAAPMTNPNVWASTVMSAHTSHAIPIRNGSKGWDVKYHAGKKKAVAQNNWNIKVYCSKYESSL